MRAEGWKPSTHLLLLPGQEVQSLCGLPQLALQVLHLILHLKHTQATPTSLPANRGITVLNTATLTIPHSLNCASIAITHANQGYNIELCTVTTVDIVSVIVSFFQEKEHSKIGVCHRLFFPIVHVDVFINQSRLSLFH